KQNADRNPDNPEYALMWDKLQGQLDAGAFLRGAPAEARASFDAKVNEWSNGADIHHQVYANAARQLLKDQQTEMAERPYSFAVAQGKLGSAVAPPRPPPPPPPGRPGRGKAVPTQPSASPRSIRPRRRRFWRRTSARNC